MTSIATAAFLNHLKSLYPLRTGLSREKAVLNNPWYIVAAVAFTSSNCPEAVPSVFKHVLRDLDEHPEGRAPHAERLLLARKFRESIFKAGLLSGYPKAINGLVALHEAMPEDLRDTVMLRDRKKTIETYERNGEEEFRAMYGETADSVQGLLDTIHPDMGWFSNTIGYGVTYGYTAITSALETSIALVAALIAADTPRQIGWHMANARRLGATYEDAVAIREIAMLASSAAGVRWKDGVPEVKREGDSTSIAAPAR